MERFARRVRSARRRVPPDAVTVADRRLPCPIVATTGALEVAVQGWDVARACGHDREIPAGLADQLLELAPLIVTAADRPWQ
jgi:hypothetical protein